MPTCQEISCAHCGSVFKREIRQLHKQRKNYFCSTKCANAFQITKESFSCSNCNTVFKRKPSSKKKTKSGRMFCSRSCAATYNNKHKKHGIRRSKLEQWLEKELGNLYPNLEIKYNDKQTIKSELDIFVPVLKLAFELNGIFHYEPIFGEDKLSKIRNNDNRKFQACLENNIELCIIDTSGMKYFKPKKAASYLSIIESIIEQNLAKIKL